MDSFNGQFNRTELDWGIVPSNLKSTTQKVTSILYYVSFVCVVCVLLGYIFIRKVDRRHDRLSLRLLVYACASHIVLGLANFGRNLVPADATRHQCDGVMFLYILADMFSILVITCIALNLELIFVHNIRRSIPLERWYTLSSFVIAFVVAIVPILPYQDGYGYNPVTGICWYEASDAHITSMWAFGGLYVWILLSIIYCCAALVMVLWKMYREQRMIKLHLASHQASASPNSQTRQTQSHSQARSKTSSNRLSLLPTICSTLHSKLTGLTRSTTTEDRCTPSPLLLFRPRRKRGQAQPQSHALGKQARISYLARVAGRVIWFPVVLIWTRLWGIVNFWYSYVTGKINPFLFIMSSICVPMQGIFLFFIFLIDPSLYNAVRTARANWKERHKTPDEEQHTMAALHRRAGPLRSPSLSPCLSPKSPQDYLSVDFDWTHHDIQRPRPSRTSTHSLSWTRSRSASEASASSGSYPSRSVSFDMRHDEIIRSPTSALISSPRHTDTPPGTPPASPSARPALPEDTHANLHSNSQSNSRSNSHSNSRSNSHSNSRSNSSRLKSFQEAIHPKPISIFSLHSEDDENEIPAADHSNRSRQSREDDWEEFRCM